MESVPSRPPHELVVDHLDKPLQGLCTHERPPVDEEGRGSLDTNTIALVHVPLNDRSAGSPGQALFEGPNVQPDRLSMRLQLLRSTFPRAGIKRVVISPELPLVIRAPSGLVRQRLPVRRIDREVPMDELYLAAVPGQELGESRLGPLSEGAVEVLELDDRHRSGFWPFERGSRHGDLESEDR